ncbi:MAG: protein kinase [Ktedonobacteraceae bacterium]|nr:protein kinase [Ktedonobacteraceae bacterium]
MLSLEGQQLGNYDVIRRIRVGGMGAVYEGRQRTAFGRRVAIKVILGDYAADRDMRRRFAREARTIARLHHPHILPLIEFGVERDILFLVMPFIDGGTLTSFLRRTLPDLDEVAAIYQQLLDAVEYAHEQGLIHRDIKSSNVLLEERRNGPPYIYLADFGLVRTMRQAESSQAGKPIPLDQVPGTPHYMAPEQTRGIVTPLTDIYALGVLLYQLLTGELPYNDPDEVRVIQMHLQDAIPLPSLRDASIPAELDTVVHTAMAKQPKERYPTIAALREAFLAALKSREDEPQLESAQLQDDDLAADLEVEDAEDIFTAPPAPLRHVPEPLEIPAPAPHPQERYLPLPQAEPAVSDYEEQPAPRHPREESIPVALVRETRDRPRAGTGDRHRQRITEEPVLRATPRPTRRTHRTWILATAVVPLTLIALLLMPRVLGYSLFPVGFPVFGMPPVATIYITPQSRTIQDTYLLTASPQVKQPDLVAHTIPDRLLRQSTSASTTVQTTGTKSIAGAQARGTLTFINQGLQPVSLPAAFVLTTPSGVRVQLTQAVNVPPRGIDNGRASVPAVAVDPGTAGNIPAHAIDGNCCDDSLMVRNSTPFSGGIDPQTTHIVSQSDLDGAQKAQVAKLQQKLVQQFQQQLRTDEVMAGQPTYKITTSADKQVGDQANQVHITITMSGSVSVYNRAQAMNLASQLLLAQAVQTLDSNYQQQGDLVASPPAAQPGKDGIFYLSVPVHGVWVYTLSPHLTNQWLQSIRGATPDAALAYLNSRPGLAAVQIDLPFGADHLPDTIDNIKIVTIKR